MPGTKNRLHQPPANARVRRMAHNERQKLVKARKRLRRERAASYHHYIIRQQVIERGERFVSVKIDARSQDVAETMDAVAERVLELIQFVPPYTCAQKKAKDGWAIVDAEGAVVEHLDSRTKARARRDELNAEIA